MEKVSVRVEKTVVISNKLKKIYEHHSAYQSLNESDQDFFDSFFSILWFDGKCTYTNKYIGERLGYAQSTIEKKIRRLDSAGLIHREQNKRYSVPDGCWLTDRTITLDPFFNVYIKEKLNFAESLKEENKKAAAEDDEDLSFLDDDEEEESFNPVLRGRRRWFFINIVKKKLLKIII